MKQIVKKGNILGGSAAGCLIDLLGSNFKDDALNLLVDYCNDYNFCSEIQRSVKKYVTENDIPKLSTLCLKVQEKIDSRKIKQFDGFTSALGNILAGFNSQIIFSSFYNKSLKPQHQQVQLDILCDYLYGCNNNEGFRICIELLSAGAEKVAFAIHMILRFAKEEDHIDYSIIKHKHIYALILIVKKKRNEGAKWALGSLHNIIEKREDLSPIIKEEMKKNNGVLKIAFCYSISKADEHAIVFQSLEDLLIMDPISLQKENFDLLSYMNDLNWIGQEELLIKLFKLRNIKLAYNLCEQLSSNPHKHDLLILEIGSINWWLKWFTDFTESNSKEWMFTDRVPRVITTYISQDKRQEFISEFNNPNSKYRKILSQVILTKMEDLELVDFTEESLTYLLEELKRKNIGYLDRNILSDIATEHFVTERMLPLLKNLKGVQRKNLEKLIESIGRQHKRRYLVQ